MAGWRSDIVVSNISK